MNMKKIVLRVLLLSFSFFLFDCGNKGGESTENAPEPKLVGNWVITEAEGPGADTNKGTKYTFTATEMKTIAAEGKYTISGDTIINRFKGLEDSPFKYLYKFEGDDLTLELLNSDGQKWTLSKK